MHRDTFLRRFGIPAGPARQASDISNSLDDLVPPSGDQREDAPSDVPGDVPGDSPGDMPSDEIGGARAGAPPTARQADQDEAELELPAELPILPLRDTIVYPFAVMPLGIGKPRSIQLIDDVMRGDRLVGLVAQRNPEIEDAGPEDCFGVGTVARIARLLRLPDGTMQIIVQGLERIAIDEFVAEKPYLRARAHLSPEQPEESMEIEALKRTAIDLFQRLVNLVQYLPDQLALAVMNLDDARQVVYLIASSAQMDLDLAPGAARAGLRQGEARTSHGVPHARARGAGARQAHPEPGPGRDGQGAARVLPARAAQGHPARTGRGQRRGRDR